MYLGMVVFLAPPVLNHIRAKPVAAVAVTIFGTFLSGLFPFVTLIVIRSLLDSQVLTRLSP